MGQSKIFCHNTMLPICLAKSLWRFACYTNEQKIENSTATFSILKFFIIIFLLFKRSRLANSLDKTGPYERDFTVYMYIDIHILMKVLSVENLKLFSLLLERYFTNFKYIIFST